MIGHYGLTASEQGYPNSAQNIGCIAAMFTSLWVIGRLRKQTLLTDAINGCFMSGVGDTSANSIGIAYDAIVTPVSEAVTNTAIASVLFIIAWDAV